MFNSYYLRIDQYCMKVWEMELIAMDAFVRQPEKHYCEICLLFAGKRIIPVDP